jgi:hypothetical protein
MTENDSTSTRRQVLAELLDFRLSLDVLRERVRTLPWDSAADEVELTTAHVLHVLSEAEAGKLSPTDVSSWAELIESREDVGFSARAANELREFVFEAANPEIASFGPERYRAWKDRLSAATT